MILKRTPLLYHSLFNLTQYELQKKLGLENDKIALPTLINYQIRIDQKNDPPRNYPGIYRNQTRPDNNQGYINVILYSTVSSCDKETTQTKLEYQ